MIPTYINDIMVSLENKCYYSALALALALPDMCGAAEWPNKSVGERYIEWFDAYIGKYNKKANEGIENEHPWISGEMVYNLRNTFLHQGSPSIISSKIKESDNQLDGFILVLGDGTKIWDAALSIDIGNGKYKFKSMIIEVTYLCQTICNAAQWYYEHNAEKFVLNYVALTQEEFFNPEKPNKIRNLNPINEEVAKKIAEAFVTKTN